MAESEEKGLVIAIGTQDGRLLTKGHFGDSSVFLLYELEEGAEPRYIEDRSNVPYEEQGHGDPGKAKHMAGLMHGVDVLVGRLFGPNVKRMLQRFVCVRVRADLADEALVLVSQSVPLLREALEVGPDRTLLVLSQPGGNDQGGSTL